MSDKYIPGYYIPNMSKLLDVVVNVLGVSSPVDIQPLKIKTLNAVGYTEKRKDKYTVFIDTNILKADELTDPVINLFIHEVWHVRQMEDGRLKNNDAYTVAIWEGVHYTMTMPHDQRPWEIDARRMEEKYLNQIKEQILLNT